jgi:hypothetical protein
MGGQLSDGFVEALQKLWLEARSQFWPFGEHSQELQVLDLRERLGAEELDNEDELFGRLYRQAMSSVFYYEILYQFGLLRCFRYGL